MSEPNGVVHPPKPAGSPLGLGNLQKSVVKFLEKEDGPTAVEYAVMLALIIVVCLAAITTLGDKNLLQQKPAPSSEPGPEPAPPVE